MKPVDESQPAAAPSTDYFLGVDVGSCTTKGVLIDGDGHVASRRVIRTKPIHQEGLEIIRRLIRSDLGAADHA